MRGVNQNCTSPFATDVSPQRSCVYTYIARSSIMEIISPINKNRDNRRSLAMFYHKEIAHLGVSENHAMFQEAVCATAVHRLWIDTAFIFSLKIGCSEKEFQKRSFRWYVPCVPRYVPFASETEKEHPKELRDETPFPKRLFRTL